MKKLFVFAGVLLLAFSPVAAQNADSVRFRRADGKPVTIETVDRDSLGDRHAAAYRHGASTAW